MSRVMYTACDEQQSPILSIKRSRKNTVGHPNDALQEVRQGSEEATSQSESYHFAPDSQQKPNAFASPRKRKPNQYASDFSGQAPVALGTTTPIITGKPLPVNAARTSPLHHQATTHQPLARALSFASAPQKAAFQALGSAQHTQEDALPLTPRDMQVIPNPILENSPGMANAITPKFPKARTKTPMHKGSFARIGNIALVALHNRRRLSGQAATGLPGAKHNCEQAYQTLKESTLERHALSQIDPRHMGAQVAKVTATGGQAAFQLIDEVLEGQTSQAKAVMPRFIASMKTMLTDPADTYRVFTHYSDAAKLHRFINNPEQLLSFTKIFFQFCKDLVGSGTSIYDIANYTRLTENLLTALPDALASAFRANLASIRQKELLLWSGDEARSQSQALAKTKPYFTDSDCSLVCFLFKLIQSFESAIAQIYPLKPTEESLHDITRCAFNVTRAMTCAFLIYHGIDGKSEPVKFALSGNKVAQHCYFSAIECLVLQSSGRHPLIVNIADGVFHPVANPIMHGGTNWAHRRSIDPRTVIQKFRENVERKKAERAHLATAAEQASSARPAPVQASGQGATAERTTDTIGSVRTLFATPRKQHTGNADPTKHRHIARGRLQAPTQSGGPKTPPLAPHPNGADLWSRSGGVGSPAKSAHNSPAKIALPRFSLDDENYTSLTVL